MTKSKMLMILLCSVLTFVLSACSSETSVEKGSSDQDDVMLRFATWDSGKELKIQQEIAKKFEEQHPGVKVQVEPYGDGFDQKLAASFGAKNPPDLMYMWNFPNYYESLEPLDKYIQADSEFNMDDFYEGLFNYNRINDKIYGVPAGFTTRVVYYNKALFDKAGIAYPEDGWTWEDFNDISKKLTNADDKQYGFAFLAEPDTYDLQGFVWSNESSFISSDGKTLEGYMNSKETVETVQMFGDMVKEGTAVLVGGKSQQSGEDIFKAGKIAMLESGIWELESFKEAGIDVGTVEMPGFEGKPVKGLIAESAVSIAKDSKNKDLAWEFVKFYASADAIKMRTTDLPVRKSVVQELEVDQDPLYAPFYKMLERSDDTPAFLLNKQWDEINRNLSAAINAVMLGENAEKVLNQAVKDSEKHLEK